MNKMSESKEANDSLTNDLPPHGSEKEPSISEDKPTGDADDLDERGPEDLSPNTAIDQDRATIDPDVEKNAQAPPPSNDILAKENYTVYTDGQKKGLVIAGSFLGLFSPMTGSIYYPALNSIAADLHATSSQINITVTTYLIIQGLAPMMIAGFSDKSGRRPAYFVCFAIYIVANLGLALQNDYVALLILRMLQSAGSSGTVALAQGLVGDCVVSADRGKYIAWSSVGAMLGPTLSPVLGGIISQYAGWHWIFWFLLILAVASVVPLVLFLPETCRNIVGDGSVPPPWPCRNLTDHIRFKNREKKGILVDEAKMAELRKNFRITIPNPLTTLVVFADVESAIVLQAIGFAMAMFYAISTGASQSFHDTYGFDDLYVSLMFLPIGVGGIIAAFTTGQLADWNYKRHAKRLGFPVDRKRQADLSDFPIELTRLQIGIPILAVGVVSVIGYGWLLTHKVSLAGPVIMLFIEGYTLTAGFQALNVLVIDIYPGKAATATAANNVCRCLLGAAASAAIIPMSNAMGYGWAYTVLAVIFGVSTLLLLIPLKYGMRWRKVKKEKEERRREAKAAKKALDVNKR